MLSRIGQGRGGSTSFWVDGFHGSSHPAVLQSTVLPSGVCEQPSEEQEMSRRTLGGALIHCSDGPLIHSDLTICFLHILSPQGICFERETWSAKCNNVTKYFSFFCVKGLSYSTNSRSVNGAPEHGFKIKLNLIDNSVKQIYIRCYHSVVWLSLKEERANFRVFFSYLQRQNFKDTSFTSHHITGNRSVANFTKWLSAEFFPLSLALQVCFL